WGLALQQILPRRMLDDVPAETIYGQIDRVASMLAKEAERLVVATCGPDKDSPVAPVEEQESAELAAVGYLTVGVVRSAGRVHGKVVQTRIPAAPVPEAEPLRPFFYATVRPFLRGDAGRASPLRHPGRAASLFRDLKISLPPQAHEVVDTLESMCEQRRQL